MKQFENKKRKGSVIIYALMIILFVSIILGSIIKFIGTKVSNAYLAQSSEQAFQVAESGIQFYRWYLAHQTDGKTALQIRDFWQSTDPYPYGLNSPYEAEYKDPEGSAIGKYRIEIEGTPNPNSTIVMVKSTGWTYKHPEKIRTIKARFRRPSWSEYVVLTKDFTRFGSGWDVHGKIMSNTGVDFNGIAHNTVYAGLSTYHNTDYNLDLPGVYSYDWQPDEYNHAQGSQVFLGGKQYPDEYPVTQKDFAGVSADISMIETETKKPNDTNINGCTSTGCHFTSEDFGRHIILNDTTFAIKTVTKIYSGENTNKIKTETSAVTYNIPDNGAIFVLGSAWVEGRVNNRRVTIVAANDPASGKEGNIYIGMNNILYANKNENEVVGLIAQGNIETIHDSLNDLEIDAAILAQNGMFGQKDYNPHCCSAQCAGLHNSATMYGSVASSQRMVLLMNRKECNAGSNLAGFYNRFITYDNNLLYYPPPYFPTGTQYSIDLWEE